MNVLIVGGTGVLSLAVTKELQRKGITITMINRGNRIIPDGVEFIKADRDDLVAIEKAIHGSFFDAVIDFLCWTQQQTENSVRFYTKYTKQYIYISSCAVYNTEELNGKVGDEESPKVLPIWKYSEDKWGSEEFISSYFNNIEANYTIVRPCVTYDDTRIPYGITPPYGYHWTLCARILANKPIITWNGGMNRCNIMRVEDFAVGVVGLIGNPKAYNEAYNICGDDAPTWIDVLNVLGELLGRDVKTVDILPEFYAKYYPAKSGEILGGRSIDSLNSNQKIKTIVYGFKQSISLKEGVAMTVKAYKSKQYQHGIDWTFDAITDRVIKKWCDENNYSSKHYNLGFIDYIGTASLSNRITYMMEYSKDCIVVKLLKRCKRMLGIFSRR